MNKKIKTVIAKMWSIVLFPKTFNEIAYSIIFQTIRSFYYLITYSLQNIHEFIQTDIVYNWYAFLQMLGNMDKSSINIGISLLT